MRIEQLVSAESGWKAVFKEPDEGESLSRILGWAIVGSGDKRELVGVIIDPSEPSRIIPAVGAVSPAGGSFARYRYVTPEPLIAAAATTPVPVASATDDTAEQLAKSFLKRRR
jgi:hypothetical protein